MALGLRLVSICVVAGFYGAAATAHSETVDLLRPTIAEDEAKLTRRKNQQLSLHSR